MSRGIPSGKALDAALPVALARGDVIFFRQDPGINFIFLILGVMGSSVISMKRTRRIHGTLAGMEADHAELLARIRMAVSSPGTTRELWLWSPYGTMRFFRVENSALVELDRRGEPLILPAAGKKPAGAKHRVNMSSDPASGMNCPPEKSTENTTQPETSGLSRPDPEKSEAAKREPPAIRYLRRRAKQKTPLPNQPTSTDGALSDKRVPVDDAVPSRDLPDHNEGSTFDDSVIAGGTVLLSGTSAE